MIQRYVTTTALITTIAALGSVLSVAHAEVDITGTSDMVCSVTLRGEITVADAEQISTAACPSAIVYLIDSPGGDVQAAMEIGRWVRQRDALTMILNPSYCYSSCALVFIGGTSRLNQGEIGLHRPYLVGAPQTEREVAAIVPEMFARLRVYAEEMGVAHEFVEVMINTPPAAMRRYRQADIEVLVPVYDPVYEEQIVARYARAFGISTQEYRWRHIEADQHCDINSFLRIESDTPPMILHENCQQAIYWGLSQSVYERRSKIAESGCEFLRPRDVMHLEPLIASQREGIERLWNEYRECRIAVMQGRDWPEVDRR